MKSLFVVLCVIYCVESNVLPVEICSFEDNQCLKTQFQKAVPAFMSGIPELGIEVMDPMNLADFKFNVSGLQFALKDGKLEGLKITTIDILPVEICSFEDNQCLKTQFQKAVPAFMSGIPELGIEVMDPMNLADFKFNVSGLQFALKDGKLEGLKITTIDSVKDDKEFIVPKNVHFDFKVKDNAHFNLTDLFNGKKDPSDTMLQFLNNDWKTVSQEFGRPILEEAAKILFENVKTYFKQNAISDIATKPLDKNGMSR
ncbi:Juvenile hormone binding protein-like protein, partial [Operophtera brumata]